MASGMFLKLLRKLFLHPQGRYQGSAPSCRITNIPKIVSAIWKCTDSHSVREKLKRVRNNFFVKFILSVLRVTVMVANCINNFWKSSRVQSLIFLYICVTGTIIVFILFRGLFSWQTPSVFQTLHQVNGRTWIAAELWLSS